MSIYPTDGEGSSLSPSRAPAPIPSSRHGSLPKDLPRRRQQETGGARPQALGSAQITESDAAAATDAGYSVVAAPVSGEFSISPPKVTELRMRDDKKLSCGQNSHSSAQWQPYNEGLTPSQTRSHQFRSAQFRGKQPGCVYAQSDRVDTSSSVYGNVIQLGGRKAHSVSGNHLLNFHFDPIARPQPQPRMPPPKRQQKIRPYNKDLFLQANYKFFVLDTGNYVFGSMDPDKMLQWEDVICVRYSTPFHVQCPICLESPLSAQITSCGHLYCFPCILRYLLMGEEDHQGDHWKKCPLCFMMISVKDLYTVYVHNVKPYNVGDHVDFTLLTRPKDSSVPLQKNYQRLGSAPCSSDDLCDSFSKFTLTSDVELCVREAKKDLNDWLVKAESGLVDDLEKLPYVCAALDQLDQRMKNWTQNCTVSFSQPFLTSASASSAVLSMSPAVDKIQPRSSSAATDIEHICSKVSVPPARRQSIVKENTSNGSQISGEAFLLLSPHVSEDCEITDKLLNDENKELQKDSIGGKDANERDSYFFYQAIDGQHLILHPLNMKCLLHHYASYDSLPERICGRIIQLETVTQSEVARKRYRFLSHFSLTTTFQLCEIDLSDMLPASALSPFIDEIKKREKQRKRLAKKEEEEKVRAEAAALHASPILYDRRHSSSNAAAFSLDDFEALGNSIAPSTSPPIVGEKLFSHVTRLGFASGHDSPALRADTSGDVSGNTELASEASSVVGRRMTTLSFASVMSATKTASIPEVPRVDGLGKKGKKPSRVLLSTAGGRRY